MRLTTKWQLALPLGLLACGCSSIVVAGSDRDSGTPPDAPIDASTDAGTGGDTHAGGDLDGASDGVAHPTDGAAADAGSGTRPWLHVEGNQIKDPAGNLVTLRGVSILDPEYMPSSPNPKTPSEIIAWQADAARGWYSRILRLDVCEKNQDPAGAFSFYEPFVQQAIDQGQYVIIDFHNVTDFGSGGTAQSTVLNFWNYFAPRYADSPNVIFEVFNEPVNPDDWTAWKSFIQPVVDAIRAVAPKNLIFMGSPQWSTRVNEAAADPISGGNIVYVFHIYPNQGTPTPSLLDSKFGTAANTIPVVITEFGWNDDAASSDSITHGTTSEWGQPFRTYMDAHPHISWVNWIFDNYWGPGIFDANWNLMSGENQGTSVTVSFA